MYLAIKWKIYNKACNKYCILSVFHRFRSLHVYASLLLYLCRGVTRLHCLLRKMTMIKTRPTTIATALAPMNGMKCETVSTHRSFTHSVTRSCTPASQPHRATSSPPSPPPPSSSAPILIYMQFHSADK